MRPTPTGRAICFTESASMALISSKDTLADTARIAFDLVLGHPGPVDMTHHHRAGSTLVVMLNSVISLSFVLLRTPVCELAYYSCK